MLKRWNFSWHFCRFMNTPTSFACKAIASLLIGSLVELFLPNSKRLVPRTVKTCQNKLFALSVDLVTLVFASLWPCDKRHPNEKWNTTVVTIIMIIEWTDTSDAYHRAFRPKRYKNLSAVIKCQQKRFPFYIFVCSAKNSTGSWWSSSHRWAQALPKSSPKKKEP